LSLISPLFGRCYPLFSPLLFGQKG